MITVTAYCPNTDRFTLDSESPAYVRIDAEAGTVEVLHPERDEVIATVRNPQRARDIIAACVAFYDAAGIDGDDSDSDFTRLVALAERFPKLTDDETDFPAMSERLTVMSGNAVLTLLAVEVNDETVFVLAVNENVSGIPMPDHNEYGEMRAYYRLPDFATGVAVLSEALTAGIGLDSAP